MVAVKGIEVWQHRKIRAISAALGMNEEDLHALAGVDSMKDLSEAQANEVIRELQLRQGVNALQRRSKKQYEAVAGGITESQQKKVWALMYQLQSLDRSSSAASLGERLCGIIKKELKIDTKPQKPFVWIDFRKGNKLIEVLKKYVSSAEKRIREVSLDERSE